MRPSLFILAIVLTPLAAQADPFAIPPSGVLQPKNSMAALYDSDLMSGAKLKTGPVEAKPLPAVKAAKPAHKTAAVSTAPSSLKPYVRHSKRPAATLPPGVVAPPPYRPGMPAYTPPENLEPAPAVYTPPATSAVAQAAPAGPRGLFGAPASAPAAPSPMAAGPAPAQAAPATTSSIGSYFSNLFSGARGNTPNNTWAGRGLFTSAAEPQAPQPYPVQQVPAQPSRLY